MTFTPEIALCASVATYTSAPSSFFTTSDAYYLTEPRRMTQRVGLKQRAYSLIVRVPKVRKAMHLFVSAYREIWEHKKLAVSTAVSVTTLIELTGYFGSDIVNTVDSLAKNLFLSLILGGAVGGFMGWAIHFSMAKIAPANVRVVSEAKHE